MTIEELVRLLHGRRVYLAVWLDALEFSMDGLCEVTKASDGFPADLVVYERDHEGEADYEGHFASIRLEEDVETLVAPDGRLWFKKPDMRKDGFRFAEVALIEPGEYEGEPALLFEPVVRDGN